MKQDINLIGGGFSHSLSSSGFETKYVNWVKNSMSAPISIYVDFGIQSPVDKSKQNYAWLCESKTINSGLYQWCENNIEYLKNNFISVFTHDVNLTKISDIFVLTQCSAKSFININDAAIYPKTKLVSMIASNKVFCEEHKYRQDIIKKFSNKCDHYGRGYNEITNKIDGLKDYCFSFVMENGTYSNMFTEKITDCFICGTIPIYYGMENIGEFFNEDGIIKLTDDFKIEDLSFELYNSKLDSISYNLEIAKSLLCSEDYIYLYYIKQNEI